MLFEPCGNLLKDYAAYCETMGVTEREDVYRSICLHEDPPIQANADGGPGSDLNTSGGRGSTLGVSQRSLSPSAPAAAAAVTPEKEDKAKRKSSKAGGKEKGRQSSQKSGTKGDDRGRDAAELVATPRDLPPMVGPVRITSVSLRYPTFCMNQRDITPLCRSMPYCPSLLSIALVGCGLSVESYVLLVEAVYTSPRIVSVTIDFNCSAAARQAQQINGFLPDPTVPPASPATSELTPSPQFSPQLLESSKVTAAVVEDTSSPSQTRDSDRDRKGGSPRKASAARPVSTGGNASGSKRLSKQLSRMPEMSVEEITPKEDEPGAVYLYPTQYCGLDQVPTPLELMLQEEREKKGKVDAKRQQHFIAQQEQLRAFNLMYRVKVPRSWDAMLYTGVRTLSLRGNHIGDVAVIEIASVLMENSRSQLMTLNLWGNEITDIGASAIATLLRGNTTLRSLDLGANKIGDKGLLELMSIFRMREMTAGEELQKYRRKVLSRPGSSDEEQRAALHPLVIAEVPTYDDIYAMWYAEQMHTEAGGPSGTPPLHLPPPPPLTARDGSAGGGSSAAGTNSKRNTPSKGKGAKADVGSVSNAATASFVSTSMRPTQPFDRSCVRISHAADSLIRVPSNCVLEVFNIGDNEEVTLAGVKEAVRRLGLHEPVTREEMSAMVDVREGMPVAPAAALDSHSKRVSSGNSRGTSASTPPNTQGPSQISIILPPELHCAEVPLVFCNIVNKRQKNRESWEAMEAMQAAMQRLLESWAAVRNGKPFGSGVVTFATKPLVVSDATSSRSA